MGNMLHGLKPVVGITKLSNHQCIVWVSIVSRELEPMLISGKLSFDLQRVVEAFTQVTEYTAAKIIPVSQNYGCY